MEKNFILVAFMGFTMAIRTTWHLITLLEKKIRVIEDLLKLCATPRFEIDWTPLMDEESDNEEA